MEFYRILKFIMFIALSRFAVANAMEDQVKQAFKQRPHLVDDFPGFIRMEVLSPLEKPNEIWLLTYWQNKQSYQIWHKSHIYKEVHQKLPEGLKLVPGSTEIRFFEKVCE